METELKLLIDPRHANAVRKHALLKKYATAKPQTQEIADTYFDTADLLIWRSKAGLRVRQADGEWMQTLKGGGGTEGGLHQRHEWESGVDGPLPDFAALQKLLDGHKPWAKLLRAIDVEQGLQPVFMTQVTRTAWQLKLPAGEEVEFALDQGTLHSNGRREAVSEIELELKSGQPQQLFEFALQLQQKIPMRISNISKAQRGYALGRARPPSLPVAVKATELKLSRRLVTEQAFQAIVANCIAQMQANEAGVADSDDVESLHQMRVGLRRLRSVLGLYKDLIIPPSQMRLDLAWLSAQLGAARDWDVLAYSTLPAIAGISTEGMAQDEMDIAALKSVAQEQAREKHATASKAVKSPRYARLMLGLAARAHGVGWGGFGVEADRPALEMPVREFADGIAGQLQNKLHKRGKRLRHADSITEVPARHRLRIAAKKMRYAVEFFQSLYPSRRVQPYVKMLTRLQDEFGQLNDATIATGLLRELLLAHPELEAAVSFARGYLAARTEQAAAGTEKLWDKFASMKALGKA